MTPAEAVERLNTVLAHAWMVRNFLKHADEAQEDEEMLEVHRVIFDSIRAVEPSRERGDHREYLRRMQGKLAKLRRVSEVFSREYRRVSTHTNFEMAALSLAGVVQHVAEILALVRREPGADAPGESPDEEGTQGTAS
jgi:hypothetical protein